MKARCKMDYLGMLGFGCIFAGGSLLIGMLTWLIHGWWIEREECKEREKAMRREDEYYRGLKASLLLHVDEMIRKVDRP